MVKSVDAISSGKSTTRRFRRELSVYNEAAKSIVSIAGKYEVDPGGLIDAFIEALRNTMASCDGLEVRCRMVKEDSAMFLATHDEKVVAQFPISLIALNNPERFKTHIQQIPIPHSNRSLKHTPVKIEELRAGMRQITTSASVRKIQPKRIVETRWGAQAHVANVIINDGTGSISLSLWNDQIDTVNVGDKVTIQHGYVVHYAGRPQLRLGRKGKLLVEPSSS
jgi:replication factor A1